MAAMSFALVALLAASESAPEAPFAPGMAPPSAGEPGGQADDGCWVQPLQLTITDFAKMGQINAAVGKSHCLRRMDPRLRPFNRGIYVVGKSRIGTLRLFGEEMPFGFNMVVAPGVNGGPDVLYTTPALDLPQPWLEAIDMATYPVLVVGTAALVTSVIIQLIH